MELQNLLELGIKKYMSNKRNSKFQNLRKKEQIILIVFNVSTKTRVGRVCEDVREMKTHVGKYSYP